jgi:hypothetical protein
MSMAKIEIDLSIPGGALPKNADPMEFKSRLTEGLTDLGKSYKSLTVDHPIEIPAPPGTAGVYEGLHWILNHHEEIHISLMLLKDVIVTGGAAGMAYMGLAKKRPAKPSPAKPPSADAGSSTPKLLLKAAGSELQLPADEITAEQFLKAVEGQLNDNSSAGPPKN